MKSLVKVFYIVIILTSVSLAKIINIPSDHTTIHDGIDAATHGDTVLVQPGIYSPISFNGKNIVLGSLFLTTGDTSYISNTVIKCDTVYAVVVFKDGEDSTAELTGFTITNGGRKGGIYCRGTSPTLRNLIVRENFAWYGDAAGGISCVDSSNVILENIKIYENNGWVSGGGIYCKNSKMGLVNVKIFDNECTGLEGGAINCDSSKMNLLNVTICGNMRSAITCQGNSIMNLVNVTIADHNDPRLGTIWVWSEITKINIVNSILWNDSDVEIYGYSDMVDVYYSDVKGGYQGIGNIDTYPIFVDTANGDYRLQEGSPCIDAGTALFIWEGDTLVNMEPSEYIGIAPDIGAFEHGDPSSIEVESYIAPSIYSLSQNYPNPFNPSTTIKYSLPKSADVRIVVYNTTGQKIQTLVSQKAAAGSHQVEFNAENLSSGVYFYRIEAGEFQDVKKMILLR